MIIKRDVTIRVIINRLIVRLLFGILCCVTLFVTSRHFVNQEVTPKWFGLIAGVGMAGIITGIFHRYLYIPLKSVFILMFLCCSFNGGSEVVAADAVGTVGGTTGGVIAGSAVGAGPGAIAGAINTGYIGLIQKTIKQWIR